MNIDYDGFLSEILQLVTSRENAVARVIRGGEPPITIGVLEGRIVTVACGPSRGLPALPRIREMVSGALIVQRVKPRSVDPDLPGNDELLSALGGSGVGKSPISATSGSTRFIGKTLVLDELPPLLSHYIGPMADFVCDDELSTLQDQVSSAEVRDLIALLAANVKDPTKCQSFQAEAQQALLCGNR